MIETFKKIFQNMEHWIGEYQRTNDLTFEKAHIQIMGQLALLLYPDPRLDKLDLAATRDLDAKITGPFPIFQEFKNQLQKFGFAYDIDSEKIWLPGSYTTKSIHQSRNLQVDVVDPISILISKAVKAKAKNKKLIQQAIRIFGDDLEKRLKKEGADLVYIQKS